MVKPPRDGNQSGRHLIIINITIIFRVPMYVLQLSPDGGSQHTADTGHQDGAPQAPGQEVGRGEEEEREVQDCPEGELGQRPVTPPVLSLHCLRNGAECVPDGTGPTYCMTVCNITFDMNIPTTLSVGKILPISTTSAIGQQFANTNIYSLYNVVTLYLA